MNAFLVGWTSSDIRIWWVTYCTHVILITGYVQLTRGCKKRLFMYLQIALPNPFVVQTAPGPHGVGSHGSGFSMHLWFKQTSPYWQSGSLTHSGPHPVMVSGFGIMPGTQLQMALPTLLTVQMVLGPQGEGWQGFTGALVVRLTKMWIGDRGTMGIRLDLKCFWIKENRLILTVLLNYLGRRTWTGLRGTYGTKGVLK